MAEPLILDTDIGGDPDDVMALLFALGSPAVEVELVVTSDEHRGHRAAYAEQLLEELGAEVPVVQGRDIGNQRCCVVCDHVTGQEAEQDVADAVEAVLDRHDSVRYACIGPQTNLAELVEAVPGFGERVDTILMGGTLAYDRDHNTAYDPEAAQAVLEADVPKRYVMKDVTFHKDIRVDAEHPIHELVSNRTPLARANFDAYFEQLHSASYMHDPLTLAALTADVVTFDERRVVMDGDGQLEETERGTLATVSTKADYDRFMDLLKRRIHDAYE